MSSARAPRLVALAVAGLLLTGCAAASSPGSPAATSPAPTSPAPTSPAPTSPAPTSPAPSASVGPGITLRQLGFRNGPRDEFSLPNDLVLATSVDQPNVVTVVLARPSPQTVEDYLRATLPASGFTIDARAEAGQALTFAGNGWTGAFTGTGTTTAIVLRPA